MLDKKDVNTIIRLIKNGPVGRAQSILSCTEKNMERLGVSRDLERAYKSTPEGSDQVDLMSIFTWMDGIQVEHKRSVWQLIAVDATAFRRCE